MQSAETMQGPHNAQTQHTAIATAAKAAIADTRPKAASALDHTRGMGLIEQMQQYRDAGDHVQERHEKYDQETNSL